MVGLHSGCSAALCTYAALSGILFALYGIDKAAARRGDSRIPERWLHALALLGGWPGAIAGQVVFQHKTKKRRFRVVFWCTVVINCAAVSSYVYLSSVPR